MFELNLQDAIEPNLVVFDRDFGSKIAIDEEKIQIDIGRRPIVKNLRALFELKGTALPEDLAIFKNYDIWLVTYTINILKAGSFKHLKEIQLDIEYLSTVKGKTPPVTIIELFPQTKFKKIIDGKLLFDATIDINGRAAASTATGSAAAFTETLSAGGRLEVSANAGAVCNITFSMVTSEIVSTGTGHYRGSWILRQADGNPLLGDQLLMQTILVPLGMPSIQCKIATAAVASGPFGMLPLRMQSKPEKLDPIQLR